MNDPNKVINVNLSSLLSLKAELMRKQAEVNKAKLTQVPIEQYIAKKNHNLGRSNDSDAAGSQKKSKDQRFSQLNKDENATIYEHEDTALLEKSQRVLASKSKFYDRMARQGGALNTDDNCLVMFNRKRQEARDDYQDDIVTQMQRERTPSSSDLSSSSDEEEADKEVEDDEDMVEYTDCLGRTRKCLRKELEDVKKRDAVLAKSMPERLDQSKANWLLDAKGFGETANNASNDGSDDELPIGPMPPESVLTDGCSYITKHDEQRANWERQEEENQEKGEIHYQDVFFDEAREHGVGYYAFSTDEVERKRQQKELDSARMRTIAEQKHRDELRAQREKIIAERVRAAKNRQRARLGLPPLEEDTTVAVTAVKEDINKQETAEERKQRKHAEKLKRKQEKADKVRELEREQHIRPWDKEKLGIKSVAGGVEQLGKAAAEATEEWTYQPEREPMSQAQWNEFKRAERNPQFAPVPETTAKLKRTNFNTSMPPPPTIKTAAHSAYNEVPTAVNMPIDDATTFSNFQSSKHVRQFQRRNYFATDAVAADVEEHAAASTSSRGAAIPPPADLDSAYALPPRAKKTKSGNELENSIEAGLRFLRNNFDKGNMSTKSTWTAKADY